MPSSFDNNFGSGDMVLAQHIQQLLPAVQGLEAGLAFYRPDISGQANFFKVDFSASGPGNKNAIDSYQDGQLVVFKAAYTITDSPWLEIVGPSGHLGAKQLKKFGNQSFQAGEIQAGQIVAAVYNSEGGGRFDAVGSAGGVSASVGSLFFGDGSDGDVTFSSDDELTEHKCYNNLTVESGVNLSTNGFKIYVKNRLTLDGYIKFDGRAALDSDGDQVGWPGDADGQYVNWGLAKGAEGSVDTGGTVISRDPEAVVYFSRGGNGGDGSAGSGGDGEGSGWGITYRSERTYCSMPAVMAGISDGGLVFIDPSRAVAGIRGGMGGGGGSGNGSTSAGGSGGSGGGIVWVAARRLAGSGALTAFGGRGGNAGGSDAGGGGGGGGGVIYLLTSEVDNIYSWGISGGQGGNSGGGSGTDGAAGADGLMVFRGGLL